jgi:hypothetical protein
MLVGILLDDQAVAIGVLEGSEGTPGCGFQIADIDIELLGDGLVCHGDGYHVDTVDFQDKLPFERADRDSPLLCSG